MHKYEVQQGLSCGLTQLLHLNWLLVWLGFESWLCHRQNSTSVSQHTDVNLASSKIVVSPKIKSIGCHTRQFINFCQSHLQCMSEITLSHKGSLPHQKLSDRRRCKNCCQCRQLASLIYCTAP